MMLLIMFSHPDWRDRSVLEQFEARQVSQWSVAAPCRAFREDPMATSSFPNHAMNTQSKRLALLLLIAAAFGLIGTGCQTTEGFGEDVEDAGENIQEEAREHR
jgi:entericidin A